MSAYSKFMEFLAEVNIDYEHEYESEEGDSQGHFITFKNKDESITFAFNKDNSFDAMYSTGKVTEGHPYVEFAFSNYHPALDNFPLHQIISNNH